MKKNASKIVTLLSAIVLTLVLSAALFACNKDGGEDETAKRNNAVNNFTGAVLNGVNGEWSADMTVDELSKRKDAGEYVLLSEWSKFFGGVLSDSPVVTSSITALNSFLTSETGKQLLGAISAPSEDKITVDFSELISKFNEIGVTSGDLTDILYLTVFKLLDGYETVFDNCSERLAEIRDVSGISVEVKNEISSVLGDMNAAKSSFKEFADSGNLIKNQLNRAKTGLSAIIDFAYGISSTAFTGNLLDSLTGGALENISENETVAYVNGIVQDVTALKNALTDEQISSISAALKLLLEKTDALEVSEAGFGTLFAEIHKYLNYVYSAVDYIPIVCDLFKDASTAIDAEFVTGLKAAFAENAPAANKGIYMSKLISAAFSEDKKERIISALSAKIDAQTERGKVFVLMQADLALNVLASHYSYSSDLTLFMTNENYLGVIALIMIDSKIAAFKDAYAAFLKDKTLSGALSSAANSLIEYSGGTLEPGVVEFSGEWYNEILYDVETKLAADYTKYGNAVKADLKKLIREFLFEGYDYKDEAEKRQSYLSYIREFAGQTPWVDDTTAEYEKLEAYYLRSMLSKIFDKQIN